MFIVFGTHFNVIVLIVFGAHFNVIVLADSPMDIRCDIIVSLGVFYFC